jgi:hypothetical protein
MNAHKLYIAKRKTKRIEKEREERERKKVFRETH